MFSVDVQTKPAFTFAKGVALPIKNIIIYVIYVIYVGRQGNPRGYDITPDGKQFIIMLFAAEAQSNPQTQQIYVTLHWFDELKQRVSSK